MPQRQDTPVRRLVEDLLTEEGEDTIRLLLERMINRLLEAEQAKHLQALPYQRTEANVLFEIVAKRYDLGKPIIITSNKSWGSWGDILPEQVMAAVILDRLLHRSVTIHIQGESFRLRQHRKAGINPMSSEKQNGRDDTSENVSNPNR